MGEKHGGQRHHSSGHPTQTMLMAIVASNNLFYPTFRTFFAEAFEQCLTAEIQLQLLCLLS